MGTYNINYSSGTLTSALGYAFSYANNASAFTVGQRAITVTASAQSATYGDTLGTLGYSVTAGTLYGSDSLSGALTTAHGGAGTVLSHANGFDVSGSPTITLQGGFSDAGLPVGFQLVGPHLSEDVLLRAGHAYQQATAWHTLHPKV
mgnify:CR=1 FL=1